MLRLAHSSAIVSAIFTTILLKGFHMFKFIDWKPTKFLNMIDDPFFRYVILAIIIYVIAFILFLCAMVIRHSAIAALLLAVVIVLLVECVLLQQKITWQNISMSFLVLTILNCRFIMETAFFHHKFKNEKKVGN